MAATNFTVAVTGTHGTHNTTVPTVPTVAFKSMGQYQLGAYASRPAQYPEAVAALNAKRQREQEQEEREAARASKPKGSKAKHMTAPDNGSNTPLAVDGAAAKDRTPPATDNTVRFTTLATATMVQLIDALMGKVESQEQCDQLVTLVDDAIAVRLAAIASKGSKAKPTAPVATPPAKAAASAPVAPVSKPETPPAPVAPTAPVAPLATLLAEAKTLHIKGAHLYKDAAKLAAVIASHKAKASKATNEAKGTTPAPLPPATVEAKSAPVAPVSKPEVAPAGTIAIADGKGGWRVLSIEEVWSIMDKVTTPVS